MERIAFPAILRAAKEALADLSEVKKLTSGTSEVDHVTFVRRYFREDGMALNSPNKLISQMAFLLAALFFLYEARISLGREKWRGYCIFGLAALAANAYSAVPAVILYFAKG